MPVSRSSAAALAILVLAGCPARDPEVRPFRIRAVDAAGQSLAAGATAPGLVTVAGTATRTAPTTLVVTPAGAGPVTVAFDPGPPPADRFPDVVASGTVRVELRDDPTSRGPGGAALPFRGLRIADASGRFRFFVGEGDLVDAQGAPVVPRPLGPEALGEDLPLLQVLTPGSRYEPSACGDVYRDRLQITGGASEVVLAEGESANVALPGSSDLPPWTVRLVAAWHRGEPSGAGDCAGALRAWFQAAGAR